MKKKIIYFISFRDIRKINPSAIAMMQTCYQLAREGYKVIFIVPFFLRYRELKSNQVWTAYGIPYKSFKILFLPILFKEGFFSKLLQLLFHFSYAFVILFSVIVYPKSSIIFISRSIVSTYPYLFLISLVRRCKQVLFLYELHVPTLKLTHLFIYKKVDHIYCITNGVRHYLKNKLHMDWTKISTIRPGFNPSAYYGFKNKIELRKALGLPLERFIVMYTGKITKQMKEIQMILNAAKALSEFFFVMVGGRPINLNPLRRLCREKKIKNIRFTGLLDPVFVPRFQMSADILLMCYPGDWPIRNSISPNKMMEYMATGNPIIAVNFDNICEVLEHKKNAFLIEPDDLSQLINAIEFLRSNKSIFQAIGLKAKKDVAKFSWENRARRIKRLIESI